MFLPHVPMSMLHPLQVHFGPCCLAALRNEGRLQEEEWMTSSLIVSTVTPPANSHHLSVS